MNEFAFDLYKQIERPNQNLIFSPYSLSSLLMILTNGAAANTKVQFINLLHLGNEANLNTNSGLLQNDPCHGVLNCRVTMIKKKEPSDFLIANALWADANVSYKPFFLVSVKQNSGQFYQVDFNFPDSARRHINQWVEEKTHNYIKELIPQDAITPETKLVLVNAIYFKGSWALPFKAENTEEKPFFLANGQSVKAKMMAQKDKFLYAENNKLQMIQLPYSKSTLALTILLPKNEHTIQEIVATLNQNAFTKLTQSAHEQELLVSIPKFKLESVLDDLVDALKKLGLTDAFTDKANFSNMTNSPFLISKILQKAIIQIDEQGTVAAAATTIIMEATMYHPPIVFEANHPFIIILNDTKTGIILFIGQVANPSDN